MHTLSQTCLPYQCPSNMYTYMQECSAVYWPRAILQPVDYGKLRVELNVERKSAAYTYRDLIVTNITVRTVKTAVVMARSSITLLFAAGWAEEIN